MSKTYQEEQNDLFKFNLNFYKNTYFTKKAYESHINGTSDSWHYQYHTLEFFISPYCNQKCDYCYLVKYQDGLYPAEIAHKDQIIKNLHAAYTYILDNDLWIPQIDFFTGEIWGTEFGITILEITLDYLHKGLHVGSIMVPSNLSFSLDEQICDRICYLVERINATGTRFFFSISIDGAVVEAEQRPFANASLNTAEYKTDAFYDKIFSLAKKYGWGFHPMIAPRSIEKQKENYLWWHDMIDKHFGTGTMEWYHRVMFFEVREPNWTDEKIWTQIEWLDFAINEDQKRYFTERPDEFVAFAMRRQKLEKVFYKNGAPYIPQYIVPFNDGTYNALHYELSADRYERPQLSCSAGHSIAIRLGDLAVIPCHRTSYEQFLEGKLITDEDNKIVDAVGINPVFNFNKNSFGTRLYFKCNYCPIEKFCMKGCLGAQYEYSKEIFYPIPQVCEFYKVRFLYLYKKALYLLKDKDPELIIDMKGFDKMYNALVEDEIEVIKKWETKIDDLILKI